MPENLKTLDWRNVRKQGKYKNSLSARCYYRKKTLNDTLKLVKQNQVAEV